MRIAQVAPLYESVPPQLYGGTERIVAYLTDALQRQGHDVTLFASGDSHTEAELIAPCARALRLAAAGHDAVAWHMLLLDLVRREAERFDLIHFHVDYLHFASSRALRLPHLTTLHGRLDLPDLLPLYRQYQDLPFASISEAQRRPLSWINWRATVPHGLPADLLQPGLGSGGYLAFLGRVAPEKRLDRAIDIARRVGLPLRIAAKIDDTDRPYFERLIAPLLKDPLVEFLGEIDERQKERFLGDAMALLFPIDWPEPFGLVMIEAMACGTPVIAWRAGSTPEVIDDGETGFLVDSIDAAIAAIYRLPALDRRRIRATFERRFTAARMARDYVAVYEQLAAAAAPSSSSSAG